MFELPSLPPSTVPSRRGSPAPPVSRRTSPVPSRRQARSTRAAQSPFPAAGASATSFRGGGSSELSFRGSADLTKLLPTSARKFGVFEQSEAGHQVLKAFKLFKEFGPEFGRRIDALEVWRDKLAMTNSAPMRQEAEEARDTAAVEAQISQEKEAAHDEVLRVESQLAWWRAQAERLKDLAATYQAEMADLAAASKATQRDCTTKQAAATESLRRSAVLESAATAQESNPFAVPMRNLHSARGEGEASANQHNPSVPSLPLSARTGRTPRDLRESRLRGPARGELQGSPRIHSGRLREALRSHVEEKAAGGSLIQVDAPLPSCSSLLEPSDDILRSQEFSGSTSVSETRYIEEIQMLKEELKQVRHENQLRRRGIEDAAKAHTRQAEQEELFLRAMHEARRDLRRLVAADRIKTQHEQFLQVVLQSEALQVQFYELFFPHRAHQASRSLPHQRADAV
eukprot:CAMPEP_0178431564 /NCGR_PEP_ID=MMETSP0689_2-20121128/31919_1 /TAXON_ID=160604 /ORGANISM="Amphidinium massartii, Strain CS-259" /LENGTH=456 /DNA_ID=CAMNT_0020053493 /DNA_START=122 /DNA_END=1489 /DNA_ORIENTATION=+